LGEKIEPKIPKYSLFMGAGCSISAGIPSGNKIIEIIQKITFIKHESNDLKINDTDNFYEKERIIDDYHHANEPAWVKYKEYINQKATHFKEVIDEDREYYIDTIPANLIKTKKSDELWADFKDSVYFDKIYGFWLEEYSEDERDRQKLIEGLVKNKEPLGAYILFANIVRAGIVKNIFTTNFDDLINEALLGYTPCIKPRVYAHNETASYINIEDEKPNIIKLHGDYLFSNIRNTSEETKALSGNMELKFCEALKKLGLVVIGYNGADYSIMSILEKVKAQTRFSLLWCVRESDFDKLNWRVVDLINSTKNSFIIKIEDFDTIIFKLWNKFNCGTEQLVERAKQFEEKTRDYIARFNKEAVQISSSIDNSEKDNFNKYIDAKDYFQKAFDSKDLNEQIDLYTKAIELKPDFLEAYINRGVAYNDLREYEKALHDHDKAIELKPDDAIAYSNRGVVYSNLEEYEKALNDHNKSIELKPDDAVQYSNRGFVYDKLKEYEKAIIDYNTAIEITPNYVDAYLNRGLIYAKLEDYDEAKKDFSQAIELKPDDPDAYYNRGLVYDNLKEYEKAIEDYSKAIKLKPSNAFAYNNRGNAYQKMKQYNLALADIENALKLDSTYSYAYATLAEIYSNLSDDEKFYENIEIALQKGFSLEKFIETEEVYNKYKDEDRFKELLKKYGK
jgi:tetratricopeptide (TPR) repeat protein